MKTITKTKGSIAPLLEELKSFIHCSSEDPHNQTMAVTAMVLTLWQEIARTNSSQPPSFLLINTEKTTSDPLNDFVNKFSGFQGKQLKPDGKGIYLNASVHFSKQDMVQVFLAQSTQRTATPSLNSDPPLDYEKLYHTARLATYGPGDTSSYSQAWDPSLELITDKKNAIILKIANATDLRSFREDVLFKPIKLQKPLGPGRKLMMEPKTFGVSGFITGADCDTSLVDPILNLGLPFFFLPHSIKEPIQIPNIPILSRLISLIKRGELEPVKTSTHMAVDGWNNHYEPFLWSRLNHLPLPHRYCTLTALLQLEDVCHKIALLAAVESLPPEKDIHQFRFALYAHTLRGLALGIAGLAWYGYGFDTSCSLSQTQTLLNKLRKTDSMSLRDIQRVARLKTAIERDDVITLLQQEGLVSVDGKNVIATTQSDFVKNLHARKELPKVPTGLC